MKKAKNRILLAIVPPGADLYEVIDIVLVQPALELEKGFRAFFAPTQNLQYFTGSIFALIGSYFYFSFSNRISQLTLSWLSSGDHKQQAELAGLRAARARFASRYSLCPKEDFWRIRSEWSPEERPARRDPETSYRILQNQDAILSSESNYRPRPGDIGRAREILRNHGFIDKENAVCNSVVKSFILKPLLSHLTQLDIQWKSPLWKLSWFRESFYARFGICISHLFPLGLVKRVITSLGICMNKRDIQGTLH